MATALDADVDDCDAVRGDASCVVVDDVVDDDDDDDVDVDVDEGDAVAGGDLASCALPLAVEVDATAVVATGCVGAATFDAVPRGDVDDADADDGDDGGTIALRKSNSRSIFWRAIDTKRTSA